jgi:hypothetical protein
MLNARTKSSAGRAERISRLAQVNPVELECLLWHSPPGVLDVSVSCSSRGRFGRTRNACSASLGSMHLEETREMKALWTGSPEVADSRDLACPRWNNFRAGRIA